MANNAILWRFENPVNLTATNLTQITWQPKNFGADVENNFTINMWLLHADASSDVVRHDYLDVLLAENQNVFNNSLWWTPPTSEIDIDVPQAGTHQLAWEYYVNNTNASPLTTVLRGFSKGFNIFPGPESSAKSTSATSTSSTGQTVSTNANSVQTSAATETSSSTKQSLILGLTLGLGLPLVLSVTAMGFFLRKQIRRRGGAYVPTEIESASSTVFELEQKPPLPKGLSHSAELPGSQPGHISEAPGSKLEP